VDAGDASFVFAVVAVTVVNRMVADLVKVGEALGMFCAWVAACTVSVVTRVGVVVVVVAVAAVMFSISFPPVELRQHTSECQITIANIIMTISMTAWYFTKTNMGQPTHTKQAKQATEKNSLRDRARHYEVGYKPALA